MHAACGGPSAPLPFPQEVADPMSHAPRSVKVAVIQAAPVLFDREATIDKACRLAAEAQAEGARLMLFPEAFVPAYPRGLGFGMVVGQRRGGPPSLGALLRERRRRAQRRDREAGRGRAGGRGLPRHRRHRARRGLRGDAVLHAALLWTGREAPRHPPQAQAHGSGAPDLGRGRREHPVRDTHAVRQDRRAHLLGELHAARAHGHVRQGSEPLPGPHRRPPRHVAGDPSAHRLRGALLRPRLEPVRHPIDVPERPRGRRGARYPARGDVPWGKRHRLAPR